MSNIDRKKRDSDMDSFFLIYPIFLIFDILNTRKVMRVANKDA